MDHTPRQLFAMIRAGMHDEALKSNTPWICVSGYHCVVRCPQGVHITDVMYDLFDPRKIPHSGYGRLANVFTNLEFERLSNAAGPTNGKIVMRDGVAEPKTVGIIHCVGSRDRNYNNYCSVIYCMQGLKFAHLVKERTGATGLGGKIRS